MKRLKRVRRDPIIGTPSPEGIAQLHEACRTADRISWHFTMAGMKCNVSGLCMMLMAIDLATGNSVLHTATSAANLEALCAIQAMLSISLRICGFGRVSRTEKPFYIVMTRKNCEGVTILHLSAQIGEQEMVVSTYCFFCHYWLPREELSDD